MLARVAFNNTVDLLSVLICDCGRGIVAMPPRPPSIVTNSEQGLKADG